MPGERSDFEDVVLQLRFTNLLLATWLQRHFQMPQSELIGILAQSGAGNTEIAKALGTTANTVKVALARQRKKRTNNSHVSS